MFPRLLIHTTWAGPVDGSQIVDVNTHVNALVAGAVGSLHGPLQREHALVGMGLREAEFLEPREERALCQRRPACAIPYTGFLTRQMRLRPSAPLVS